MQFIDPSEIEEFFVSIVFEVTGKTVSIRYSFADLSHDFTKWLEASTPEGKGYLLKWNEEDNPEIYEREWVDCKYLQATGFINVPEIIQAGSSHQKNWLLMALPERKDAPDTMSDLGVQLGHLHLKKGDQAGFIGNNYIGRLQQLNPWTDSALDFWVQNRLLAQAGLAMYEEKMDYQFYDRFLKLADKLKNLIPDEEPTLLHGNLWEANFYQLANGTSYFFNPACYYGLREAEVAATKLLGSFDQEFYDYYLDIYPLEPGFHSRKDIYNLHPLLVMVNQGQDHYLPGIADILNKYGC